MSEPDDQGGGEVLRSLPATRPQRRSARRDRAAKAPAATPKSAAAPKGSFPKSAETAKPSAASARAAAKPARKRAAAGAAAAKRPSGGAKRAGAKPTGARLKGVRPSEATRAASSTPGERPANPPEGIELVGTAIQAAGELAQLGMSLGTKALRGAVRRIPRP